VDDSGVVPDETYSRRWAELATLIRSHRWIIVNHAIPDVGTPFHLVDEIYPRESASQWSREGLRSALDHLAVWANFAVPLEQFEGQVVKHEGFRWYFTLMRAALEGAAQSIWISGANSAPEAVARLVRMVRHDVGEQAKAWSALGRDPQRVRERLASHANAAESLADYGPNVDTLPAMVDLIRGAATRSEHDPNVYEAHWRVCSAAAHGKDWAILELQKQVGEAVEWMPGQFHFTGHVDPDRLTEVLNDTVELVSSATILYLQRATSGDIAQILKQGLWEAARITPQKDGGAHIRQVAHQLGIDVDDGIRDADPPAPEAG
jgi:hypothetical protein